MQTSVASKLTRAWSTSVRASGMSPDMAAPMCVSISMIFSTLSRCVGWVEFETMDECMNE